MVNKTVEAQGHRAWIKVCVGGGAPYYRGRPAWVHQRSKCKCKGSLSQIIMGLRVTLSVNSIKKVCISPPKCVISPKYIHRIAYAQTGSYMNETRQMSKNTLKNDKITCVCHYPYLLVGPQHGEKKCEKGGTTRGQ